MSAARQTLVSEASHLAGGAGRRGSAAPKPAAPSRVGNPLDRRDRRRRDAVSIGRRTGRPDPLVAERSIVVSLRGEPFPPLSVPGPAFPKSGRRRWSIATDLTQGGGCTIPDLLPHPPLDGCLSPFGSPWQDTLGARMIRPRSTSQNTSTRSGKSSDRRRR